MRDFFRVPRAFTAEDAQRVRKAVMLAPERVDYLHRALNNQRPNMRMAMLKFREDGILLPYGCSRRGFDTPNPYVLIRMLVMRLFMFSRTFFQDDKVWPMKDDADPHGGWAYSEYMRHAPAAKNDVNGGLFFYVQRLLLQFCRKIRSIQIDFQIFSVDARNLCDYLDQPREEKLRFDRIEVCYLSSSARLTGRVAVATSPPYASSILRTTKRSVLTII